MIDVKEVLAVDGGLSYIHKIYPDSIGCETRKGKFKAHEEKTPSASLMKMSDGTWIVTDFGGDAKGRNAIKIAQKELGLDFRNALLEVASHYGITENYQSTRATFNQWPATPDEPEGALTYKVKPTEKHELQSVFTDSAWKVLGKDDEERIKKGKEYFEYYRFKALEYYRRTSEGETTEFGSHDKFPIILIDEGTFGKIYMPKAQKKFRFQWIGKKPANYIHGLVQHINFVNSRNEASNKEYDSASEEEREKKRKEDFQFDEIVMCSGGSDALNLAAFGYKVIWRNSETEYFHPDDYKSIMRICKSLINLPDIDATGISSGHALALQYLDMKTAWLPYEMLKEKDAEGKPIYKDFRDWLRLPIKSGERVNSKYEVQGLINTARQYKFWDEEPKIDSKGNPIFKFGRTIMEYRPNNLRMYNFLYHSGFMRYSTTDDGTFKYLQVEKGIAKEVTWSKLKEYINNFLEERNENEDLRNTFYRTPHMSDSSFSNLPLSDLDFENYGPDFQYLFFDKMAWRITQNGIEEQLQANGKTVWEEKVLRVPGDHRRTFKPKITEAPFRIIRDEDGELDIEVVHNDCMFFNFLVQVSRIYWRRELEERLLYNERTTTEQVKYLADNPDLSKENLTWMNKMDYEQREAYLKKYKFAIDGPLLTQAEIKEQKQHLLNKLFCIGYVLHRYKFSNRPWAVWSMDYKISEDGEAHGGAGKSILTRGLKYFLKTFILPGQQLEAGKMDFILDGVTEEYDLILSDDTGPYVNFKNFYEHLTSDMSVARKGMKALAINYKKSPKFWFNSNFGDKFTEPSDMRRKVINAFSDYYHKNTGDYLEDREPKDDFGKQLFDDWNSDEWNHFFNTMARTVQFYLGCDNQVKIPEGNVEKRNLITAIGEGFRAWADSYFADKVRLDSFLSRNESQESFYNYNKGRITPQSFMKKLKAWCKLMKYELNPKEFQNSSGRIIRGDGGITEEKIFIKTKAIAEDVAF